MNKIAKAIVEREHGKAMARAAAYRSGTSSMEMMSYLMRRKNASMPVRRSTVMLFPGITKATSSAVLTRCSPAITPAPRTKRLHEPGRPIRPIHFTVKLFSVHQGNTPAKNLKGRKIHKSAVAAESRSRV